MPYRSAAATVCVALALSGCAATADGVADAETRTYVLRLTPGTEVKSALVDLARRESLVAASIVSAVGSLTDVALRYADRPTATELHGRFEVVALSGHLTTDDFHVHAAVSDGDGRTYGGHVMEGCKVYTTLVVVVQEHLRWRFVRKKDPTYGYFELEPTRRSGEPSADRR
jgi:predicted DNA-binding protein with PD1-like motif